MRVFISAQSCAPCLHCSAVFSGSQCDGCSLLSLLKSVYCHFLFCRPDLVPDRRIASMWLTFFAAHTGMVLVRALLMHAVWPEQW